MHYMSESRLEDRKYYIASYQEELTRGNWLPSERESLEDKHWDNSEIINFRKLGESESKTIQWELWAQKNSKSYEAESIIDIRPDAAGDATARRKKVRNILSSPLISPFNLALLSPIGLT